MDLELLKDVFWEVVVDCLIRFHGFAAPLAREEALGLRDRVESPVLRDLPASSYDGELIYHAEPFYVACDIARRQLSLDQLADAYGAILDGRYAAAERDALADGMGPRAVQAGLSQV